MRWIVFVIQAEHIPGVLVLHIVAGMNFANKDAVRATIFKQLEKNKDLKVREDGKEATQFRYDSLK